MKRLIRLSALFVMLAFLAGSFGCSNRFSDGVPISINPTVSRVGVNDTVQVTVFLSQPREAEGTIQMNVGNTDVLRPAGVEVEVPVAVGQDSVQFLFQGIAPGTSVIYAQMDGAQVKANVIVLAQ